MKQIGNYKRYLTRIKFKMAKHPANTKGQDPNQWHDAKWISIGFGSILDRFLTVAHLYPSKKNNLMRRAPLLRREFEIEFEVVSATLNICGLGYYEALINQQRVGDQILDPAQTDYDQRVFYNTHDVTKLVRKGKNCLGIMLGNGFFHQDRVWGKYGLDYGQPRLICKLQLILQNGTVKIVTSNNTWKVALGPVMENNVYAGESYDARLEQIGWETSNFDDTLWRNAVEVRGPKGRLVYQVMPPIRKIEEKSPQTIKALNGGRYILDFGQNLAGWVKIHLHAPTGTEIQMRFAEARTPEGEIDTGSTGVFATKVEQIDTYIAKGFGEEIWEPRFTYHGFRYVEIKGWPDSLTYENVVAVVVHTDLRPAGSFVCSDERLNQLHNMALWTHRSNIHSIPEDCPARERCGWLGDANLVAEFSMWNFHAYSFWEKYLDDIETTRIKNGGIPANIAPGKRGTHGAANPDWAAAFIMIPWYLYVQYGDSAVLKAHWEGMEQLMSHFAGIAKDWIITTGYGDWFDPIPNSPPERLRARIVNNTPVSFTSTLWFYRCTEVMQSVASVLGFPDRVKLYAEWKSHIHAVVIQSYYEKRTGSFGSQTANAMALAFGLVPDGERPRIIASLVDDIRNRQTHLSTGIMGVRVIFEVLTQSGHGDIALALMHQNTYPSFGHLISRGATTLWEWWGEPEHDITHGPRSMNHPMMGGYDNWFFTTLAGIRSDPKNPGFKHFFLHPYPIPGLEWVRCRYESPAGPIVSEWTITDGKLDWKIIVPPTTTATITLPYSQKIQELTAGEYRLTDYHKQKLVKSEYDTITEIEEHTGVIPIVSELKVNTFGIIIQDNHVIGLGLFKKNLTSLPESIGNLTSLQKLNLQFNQLTSLPESITRLTSLQHFDLQFNQLTSVPESIEKLTSLQYLNLRDNELAYLPERIKNLLKKLRDRGCRVYR